MSMKMRALKGTVRPGVVMLSAATLCGLIASGGEAIGGAPPVGAPANGSPAIGTPPARHVDDDESKAMTITVRLLTSKRTYRQGETVRFTIIAQNIGKTKQTLKFRSGQSFDITAVTDDDEQRWDWSRGRMFTQALRQITLEPGAARQWAATWKQVDNDGALMARGEVIVTAKLMANGGIRTAPRTIKLAD